MGDLFGGTRERAPVPNLVDPVSIEGREQTMRRLKRERDDGPDDEVGTTEASRDVARLGFGGRSQDHAVDQGVEEIIDQSGLGGVQDLERAAHEVRDQGT